jgi:ATP-dependent DNA helicase PIF1
MCPGLYQIPQHFSTTYFINFAILNTINKDEAVINGLLFDVFFGKCTICFGANVPTIDNEDLVVKTELLHLFEADGLPPPVLRNIGAPIMLLQNICTKQGLFNGTNFTVRTILPHVIEALVATSSPVGKVAYIPKIKLLSGNEPTTFPLSFSRIQFLVRHAFAMTIKLQTMGRVGLYLQKHVFSHGQLYVALFSRVKSPAAIKFMIHYGKIHENGDFKICSYLVLHVRLL